MERSSGMRKRSIVAKAGALLISVAFLAMLVLALCGCAAYRGGKVVDGTNLEIGISIPGTEWTWTINALAYTGGLKVCGDQWTEMLVTNKVSETNSYFGVVKTNRSTEMTARIIPKCIVVNDTNGVPIQVVMPDAGIK